MQNLYKVYVVEYATNQGWKGIGEDGHSLSHDLFKMKVFTDYMKALDWKGTMDSEHFSSYRVSTYTVTAYKEE